MTKTPEWHLFVPKLFVALREGYGWGRLMRDVLAGLTVAIVALPLAMALAIASGAPPERGLYTAIVAGFLISMLGGSRHQIGGPTGAFVVVVFNVIQEHGYDGLLIATMMAGAMLIVFGLARFGTIIKYIPYPVVTGFTAGIAVIIFSSQIKDLLGLDIGGVPADFIEKWALYLDRLGSAQWSAIVVAALSLLIIGGLRRWRPTWPAFLFAVVASSLLVWATGLDIDTIGSRFGGIPSTLPSPSFPEVDLERLGSLVSPALTIAFLAGIESLLSAMVADGLTGRRHKSNCELVAQGVANIASPLFGGLPATGAIARTVTNIKAGAETPVAGMVHAAALLLFTLLLAPLAAYVPLAALAGVLIVVAWNMSEYRHFRHLMTAPRGDRVVLLVTFGLTVLVDLTLAIQVGVVLSALLFMKRMADVTTVDGVGVVQEDPDDLVEETRPYRLVGPEEIPAGVEVFQINGPFFFGAASKLTDVLDRVGTAPAAFILRMRQVPVVDATGIQALAAFISRCKNRGTEVILTGVQPQPRRVIERMRLDREIGPDYIVDGIDDALALSRRIAGRRDVREHQTETRA